MRRPTIQSSVEYHWSDGSVTYLPGSSWSPGQVFNARPESEPRRRPRNLSELGSLTPWGGHTRQYDSREPQTEFAPLYGGGKVIYKNDDPSGFVINGAFLIPPPVDWQTALRLAVKDQKVNMAQTLAEYKQAQNMFASNATAVAKALRGLKRGNLNEVFDSLGIRRKKLRGTISNRWLELRYGWMPLIQDINGSVQELQAAMQRPRFRKISVRKAEIEEDTRKEYFHDYAGQLRNYERRGFAKTVVKVVCYLRQDSLAAVRLGFTNPAALAWELLPYSFVIDWLIPIGDWLNSLDACVGVIGAYGTVTTKTKSIYEVSYGSQHSFKETYSRQVFDHLPSPVFPSYSPSLGLGRIANALALLSQLKR